MAPPNFYLKSCRKGPNEKLRDAVQKGRLEDVQEIMNSGKADPLCCWSLKDEWKTTLEIAIEGEQR